MDSTVKAAAVTRYRPTGWEDFKTYAANLGWLLQVPTQRAQEILARIYGYSGTHELHQNLKRPGVPGVVDPTTTGQRWAIPYGLGAEAHNRTLDVVREARGMEGLGKLSKRDWKVVEIGLFLSPGDHKEHFKQVKLAIQVNDQDDVIDGEMTVGHYATLVIHQINEEAPEEARLHFTDIGRAVFAAAMDVVPDERTSPSNTELFAAIDKLEALMRRHPNNPWLPAIYVCSFSKYYFQDSWADNLPMTFDHDESRRRQSRYTNLDADGGYVLHSKKNAKMYLQFAKRSIEMFDGLLGPHAGKAPDHRLVMEEGDTFYYPAIHYFGAMVAANAGEASLALRWAQKNLRLVPGDNFGSRFLVAALFLNDGRPASSIERLCKAENRDGWLWTCVAAAAASGGNKSKTLKAFSTLLVEDWAPLEVYSATWPELRASVRPGSNHGTPAFFQELDYRTKPFWAKAPHVRRLFERVCGDKEIRHTALAHHTAQSLGWGMAFLEADESARRTRQMAKAADEFMTVLEAKLPQLWQEVMGACEVRQ